MRVTIDYTPAIQQHAGIGRYADELARALLDACGGDDLALFYVDWQRRTPAPPLDALPRTTLPRSNKPWRLRVMLSSLLGLPMDRIIGERVEVFHATDHLLPPVRHTRSVFTLYDLTFLRFPDAHLPLNRWFSRLMIPRFLRSADAIIAISECTKRDAVECYGIPNNRISVIQPGVHARFQPIKPGAENALRLRYKLPERYLLSVGTIEPRKNLIVLLEAYRRLKDQEVDVQLVIAGRRGWRHDGVFDRLREIGLEGEVTFLGFVPDEDLPELYARAEAFVFPSLYEGFGLPVLEAMACGTPVVCSDAPSLPEVAGDAALLIDPRDPHKLADAVYAILTDPALAADLRRRGLVRAQRFTWEHTARETLAVYRQVSE